MATISKVSPEQILDALAARPGASAAGLAEALGIGQSTAAKHLASLEATGAARREPGGRNGARRLADRWYVVAEAESGDTDGAADPVAVAEEEASMSGGRLGRGALGVRDATARLRRGELRDLVVEHLRAHPGEVSPAQLSRALGHSAGAIGNALVKLADAGQVVRTSDHPRRYAAGSNMD